MIFLLAAILFINPVSIFGVLAFFGADTVVLSAISLRMLKKMQNGHAGHFGPFTPPKDENHGEEEKTDEDRDDDHDERS